MDWKSLVGTLAPVLGTAVGGPLGGIAVKALGDALGLSGATEASIQTAISGATPEQLLAIKNADNDFALKMQALGFDHVDKIAALNAQAAQNEVTDVVSARNMQTATKSIIVPIISISIVGSFITLVASTLLGYSHVESALAGTLVGYLSAKAEQVMSFYYGGKHDDAETSKLLANSTPIK